MSSIERNGGIAPIIRDPFNHASRLPTKDLIPPARVELPDDDYLTPERRESLVGKVKEGMRYMGAFDALHERVPVTSLEVYDENLNIRLDNVTARVDGLMYAARNAVTLYDVLMNSVFDLEVTEDRITRIRKGENNLGEAILFLDSMRKLIPEMLDKNPSRQVHPSTVITPEGVVALSYLSKPAPSQGSSQEVMNDYRMKRRLAKSLLRSDSYATKLYKQNKGLFNGNALRQPEPVYNTGQYL